MIANQAFFFCLYALFILWLKANAPLKGIVKGCEVDRVLEWLVVGSLDWK